ncbi:MAG: MarR family transcriptional regulator [Clostridiaceae bacterium]
MELESKASELRESVRLLERKLGILEDGEMSCCSLTLAQCHALVEIGRAKCISLIELAKLLDLDNSTLSRTVNNLVNSGMVERALDPNDRRYVTIRLSPEGDSRFREIESNMNEYFIRIFAAIPDGERTGVLKSLQILLKAIEDSDCC